MCGFMSSLVVDFVCVFWQVVGKLYHTGHRSLRLFVTIIIPKPVRTRTGLHAPMKTSPYMHRHLTQHITPYSPYSLATARHTERRFGGGVSSCVRRRCAVVDCGVPIAASLVMVLVVALAAECRG